MKVLFIVTAFAPENEIGCIRTTKIAKYLVRKGNEVTVISPSIVSGMNTSDDLMCNEISQINHVHIPYSKLFYKILYSKRNSMTANGQKTQMRQQKTGVKRIIYKLIETVYTDIRNYDWYQQVKKHLKETKYPSFDFVFSSYPSICSHWGAMFAKKRQLAKYWIADFRDPMVYETDITIARLNNNRRQRIVVERADKVLIVSEGLREKFVGNGVDDRKVIVIPNGYDPDDFTINEINHQNLVDNTCFNLAYCGGLYGGKRDLSPLFKEISNSIKQGLIHREKIKFHYAGKEFAVLLEQAKKYYVSDILIDHGFMEHRSAIELEKQCDCTVVCTHNTKKDKGIVTGKLYECLAVEKFIICVVNGDEPNSAIAEIINRTKAGVVYEQANDAIDAGVLSKAIVDLYTQKKQTGRIINTVNVSEKKRFEYAAIAERIINESKFH